MTPTATTLEPPVLLLAMPQVLDPFFHQGVVLLLHHDDEGSFGFLVNRRTGIEISEILEGMDMQWGGAADAVAHLGGPVQPQIGTVLFTSPGEADGEEEITPILEGLSMTQHVDHLERLALDPPPYFRLVLGYAGWGAGQLVEEILRNDWLLAPAERDLLCSTAVDELWSTALERIGVDPDTLPSWTGPEPDPEAN